MRVSTTVLETQDKIGYITPLLHHREKVIVTIVSKSGEVVSGVMHINQMLHSLTKVHRENKLDSFYKKEEE